MSSGSSFLGAVGRSARLGGQAALLLRILLGRVSKRMGDQVTQPPALPASCLKWAYPPTASFPGSASIPLSANPATRFWVFHPPADPDPFQTGSNVPFHIMDL